MQNDKEYVYNLKKLNLVPNYGCKRTKIIILSTKKWLQGSEKLCTKPNYDVFDHFSQITFKQVITGKWIVYHFESLKIILPMISAYFTIFI